MRTEMPHVASPESTLLTAQSAVKDADNRAAPGLFASYLELTKPRILILILLTTIAGFCLASQGSLDKTLLLHLNIGVGLLAAGIGALNQFFERDVDGLMRRTERRPLPSGRISPAGACIFGILTSVLGVAYLALFINAIIGVVGLYTLISYVLLYTPLKRKTPSSTFIGAFPGAVPPLIGWTAVRGEIGTEALVLFLIMFLWQFPHFLAIAWMYREDYARAGIKMLPIVEPEGVSTGRQIVFYAVALVPVSLIPTWIGLAGNVYFFGALVLSLGYLYFGLRSAMLRSRLEAKRLLQASILYLPLLFVLMLLDKTGIY